MVTLAFPSMVAAEKSAATMLEFHEAALNMIQGETHGAEIGPSGCCLEFIDGVVNATLSTQLGHPERHQSTLEASYSSRLSKPYVGIGPIE